MQVEFQKEAEQEIQRKRMQENIKYMEDLKKMFSTV